MGDTNSVLQFYRSEGSPSEPAALRRWSMFLHLANLYHAGARHVFPGFQDSLLQAIATSLLDAMSSCRASKNYTRVGSSENSFVAVCMVVVSEGFRLHPPAPIPTSCTTRGCCTT